MQIVMPRGDIRPVSFTVNDTSGNPAEFDEIYFTVKKTFRDTDYVLQKRLSTGEIELQEDGSYSFVIEAKDTENLKVRVYVFDIEVISGTDIKQTFIGTLALRGEVTYAENEV